MPQNQAPRAVVPGLVDKAWADKNRAAIQLLEAGEPEQATKLFEACLQAVPGEAVFAENLAESLARSATGQAERGSKEGRTLAIESLRRARQLAPARKDLV